MTQPPLFCLYVNGEPKRHPVPKDGNRLEVKFWMGDKLVRWNQLAGFMAIIDDDDLRGCRIEFVEVLNGASSGSGRQHKEEKNNPN